MIEVTVNEIELKKLAIERIDRLINDVDSEKVFWSAKDLMEMCSMSWNFIQEQFFYDERLPKRKIGAKWFFHAKDTRKFLEAWFYEQVTK